MINEIDSYDDVIAGLTDTERADVLTDELTVSMLSNHAGAQVNTDADAAAREVMIGHSTYLVVDARSEAYHPVFGVR